MNFSTPRHFPFTICGHVISARRSLNYVLLPLPIRRHPSSKRSSSLSDSMLLRFLSSSFSHAQTIVLWASISYLIRYPPRHPFFSSVPLTTLGIRRFILQVARNSSPQFSQKNGHQAAQTCPSGGGSSSGVIDAYAHICPSTTTPDRDAFCIYYHVR
jgi:hypothetical protein